MKKIIRIFTIILMLIFISTGQITAQEIPEENQVSEEEDKAKDDAEDEEEGISEYFSAHKPNYILLYNHYHQSTDHDFPSTEAEIKFQLSFKHNIMWLDFGDLYIAYTQKSFWQTYDEANSRPFRETNYNPELFFRTADWNGFNFDIGAEHESNGGTYVYTSGGEKIDKSRSWNRFYIIPRYKYNFGTSSFFQIEYKLWDRVNEDPKTDDSDVTGDENPDIRDYYGLSELRAKLKLGDFVLSTMARKNFNTKKGAFEANMSYPIITGLYVNLQFFEGYGESLIDYNNRKTTYGIGLMFTR
ncbi:MAG: phospholipase A [Desulfobacterales bacterium]|nr:phospholipase A [Desulfobacterales bacterium]